MTTENICISGANGYLGGWMAAALLFGSTQDLVLPIRAKHDPEMVKRSILKRAKRFGKLTENAEQRLHVVTWEQLFETPASERPIGQWVHSAASMEYRNRQVLEEANIGLTQKITDLAKQHPTEDFMHVSTAFSSGLVKGTIKEDIHPEPEVEDPTPYTWSKRQAEKIVANSGLPWRVLRPGIVIGDSTDGYYDGREVGPYQIWCAYHRLFVLSGNLPKNMVAPNIPLQLVHIDHFLDIFKAYFARPDFHKRVVHATSNRETLPTSRDMAASWFKNRRLPMPNFHEKIEQTLDIDLIREVKIFIRRASENFLIASHDWRFETEGARELLNGETAPVASVESVIRCQERFFMALSETLTGAKPAVSRSA